mgnify:CR=1 FL=1
MGLFSFFNKELAIDLGTANTVIIYNDKVVVDEPSIIAIERDTQRVMAVGKQAMMMQGRTHENIRRYFVVAIIFLLFTFLNGFCNAT